MSRMDCADVFVDLPFPDLFLQTTTKVPHILHDDLPTHLLLLCGDFHFARKIRNPLSKIPHVSPKAYEL